MVTTAMLRRFSRYLSVGHAVLRRQLGTERDRVRHTITGRLSLQRAGR